MWTPFRKKKTEERSATDESWQAISPVPFAGGLTPRMAENLSVVGAAVDLISTSIASCPAYVYAATGGRRTELPAPSWLVRPNRYQGWNELVAMMLRSALLYGNSLIQIAENGRGEIAELRPWPWQSVSWQIGDGRIRWTVTDSEGAWGPAGHRYVLNADECLHLKDAQDLAYIGISRLSRARQTFLAAEKANSAAERLYDDAVRPSGALTTEAKMDPASRERLRGMLKGFTSSGGKGALVLDSGMKWTPFSLNSEDAELLDSRRFSVEELARVYGVPPYLLGDTSRSSYNIAEASVRSFVQFTLLPWVSKLESLFASAVLPQGQKLVIDLEGLQRADMQAQWTAWNLAVNAGVLAVDEVREACGYDALGGEFAIPRTFNAATAQEGGQSNGQDA